MKAQPICEILRRIKPLAPFHKAAYLRGVLASEPRRGIRRRELESELQAIMNKQLKKEARGQ